MKTVFSFLKKTFYNTAAIYAVTSVVFMISFYLASDEAKASYGAVPLFTHSLLFGFAAALVLSIFGSLKKIPSLLRYCIEFVLIYASFYFSLFYLTGNRNNFSAFFAFSVLFVIFYAVAAAVTQISARKAAEKKSAAEYHALFDESADKEQK